MRKFIKKENGIQCSGEYPEIEAEQMPIDIFMSRLPSYSISSSGYMANCPSHCDNKPSLSFKENVDGKLLIHCFAGCTYEEIMDALELDSRHLFPSTYALCCRGELPKKNVKRCQPKIISKNECNRTWYLKGLKYTGNALAHLSLELGIESEILRSIGFGFNPITYCWSVPERDHNGEVVGVLNRLSSGEKRTLKGSIRGLVYDPDILELSPKTLYLAEGPTDTAALISVGKTAIGRPAANPSARVVDFLIQMILRMNPSQIVIVADNDDAGIKGAITLQDQLLQYYSGPGKIQIRVPFPGFKDARAQIIGGRWTDGLVSLSRRKR